MKVTVCYYLMTNLDFTEEEINRIKNAKDNLKAGDYITEIAKSKSEALCNALDSFDKSAIAGVYENENEAEDEIIWEADWL